MKIGVVGCAGRMGQQLIREITQKQGVTLSGAVERAESPALGKDAGILAGIDALGVEISADREALFKNSDAVIDFTSPENTLHCAAFAAKYNTIHVIGTTGMTEEHKQQLAVYAKETRIIWSANMSIGVNILQGLVEKAAAILDDSYDIEIVEMHHRHKVDAPSGTALMLGEAAARGRGVDFKDHAVLSREGITGAREQGSIGFATLRGGDVIGDHSVIFAAEGERIEITHKSSSRTIYTKGAVRAATWAKDKPAGLYSMKDVLGL